MKVLNKRTSSDGVYIGRPSKFGNPFVIGRDGTRADVVAKFEKYLMGRPDLIEAAKRELAGYNLVCWCAPEACHGDVLLRVANEMTPEGSAQPRLTTPAEGSIRPIEAEDRFEFFVDGTWCRFPYKQYETTNELGLRWYHTPAGPMPSITSVLGVSETAEKKASLENWRNSLGHDKAAAKTKQATDHGTMVHLMAERFLKGEDPYAPVNGAAIPGPDTAAFNSLKLKLKKIVVWGQEKAVYSPALEVAGRFDCAGTYKDVPSIIDFKTSLTRLKTRKDVEDYELQLTFYAFAHNELFGTKIKQGVILLAGAGGMPQEFIVDVDAKLDPLIERIGIFWERTLAKV